MFPLLGHWLLAILVNLGVDTTEITGILLLKAFSNLCDFFQRSAEAAICILLKSARIQRHKQGNCILTVDFSSKI